MAAKELPRIYSEGVSKIKSKRLKKLVGTNLANMFVDSGASYNHDKL